MTHAQQKRQEPVDEKNLWDEGLFGGEPPAAAAGGYTALSLIHI